MFSATLNEYSLFAARPPPYLTLPTLITLQVPGFGHLRRSLGEDIIGVRGNAPSTLIRGGSPSNSTPKIFIMQEKCSVGTEIPKKAPKGVFLEHRSKGEIRS